MHAARQLLLASVSQPEKCVEGIILAAALGLFSGEALLATTALGRDVDNFAPFNNIRRA